MIYTTQQTSWNKRNILHKLSLYLSLVIKQYALKQTMMLAKIVRKNHNSSTIFMLLVLSSFIKKQLIAYSMNLTLIFFLMDGLLNHTVLSANNFCMTNWITTTSCPINHIFLIMSFFVVYFCELSYISHICWKTCVYRTLLWSIFGLSESTCRLTSIQMIGAVFAGFPNLNTDMVRDDVLHEYRRIKRMKTSTFIRYGVLERIRSPRWRQMLAWWLSHWS